MESGTLSVPIIFRFNYWKILLQPGWINCIRIPVPVAPCAPMEIKGSERFLFGSLVGIPYARRISERNSSMRLRAMPRSSLETA